MDLLLAAEIVRERLTALSSSLGELADGVDGLSGWPAAIARHEHGHRPVVTSGVGAVRAAATAFRRVDFHNEQDERRVVRFVGALAATAAVLRSAEAVNEHKVALMSAIGTYRKLASKRERDSHQVRELLIRFGYARLNLVQAYRKIPILERTPARIGFSWILGTKHVETVDREDAMRRVPGDVERSGSDLARIQREVMETRRNGLRVVRRVAPHVRANIAWVDGEERQTACIHAPLPILYRFSASADEPEIAGHDRPEPDPRTRASRQRRSDANLQRIPGTIDVYRVA
jgi:hypothetical protein